jgi:hypothetical protein
MVATKPFASGDEHYLDWPTEEAKFRYEKETGKVYRRFYGEKEEVIKPNSDLYNHAISVAKIITREEYFRD